MKSINKTQYAILSRLVNAGPHSRGSIKLGYTISSDSKSPWSMNLHKMSEGNQAHALCEKMPDIFEARQIMFRLVNCRVLDDLKAREVLKYNSKFENV